MWRREQKAVEEAGKPVKSGCWTFRFREVWAGLELVGRSWREVVDSFEVWLEGRIFWTF